MLIKNLLAHKKIALAISLIYSGLLLAVCLINLNDFPKVAVEKGDKIFHFLAYLVFTFLWYNTFSKLFSAKFWKVIFITIVFSIAFGIIIELLQGSLTTFRTADYHDVIANSLGVMMAGILIVSTRKRQVKKL